MLPIKTPCKCGARPDMIQSPPGHFHVRCPECKFASDDRRETMTVALMDWEHAVAGFPSKKQILFRRSKEP